MTTSPYRAVIHCRMCGSQALEQVWDLGEQYVTDFLTEGQEGFRAPLVLLFCHACRLAQLRHTVERDLMYRTYYYRSGTSETMRAALSDVVERALEQITPLGATALKDWRCLKPDTTVLDIGANDGYLLQQYPASFHRVAVEPAGNIEPQGASAVVRDYFSYDAVAPSLPRGKAMIITSIAMFYDVDAPRPFLHSLARLLERDGVWVLQMNFTAPVMRSNAFDFLSHEHLTYWTLGTLQDLLRYEDMEVYDVEELPLNGGTYRVFIQHRGARPVTERAKGLISRDIAYETPQAWRQLKERVDRNGAALRALLARYAARGERVFVAGASTRGNSLLQYYRLGVAELPFAADRDPRKAGRKMVGTNITVISEEDAYAMKPAAFLLLPYSYLEQFVLRSREVFNSRIPFIVPLPEVKVVKVGGVQA